MAIRPGGEHPPPLLQRKVALMRLYWPAWKQMLNGSAKDCGQILMLNCLGIIGRGISCGAIA